MSLEEFIPDIDSSEGGGTSAESGKEASEKFKDAIKKASKKAKKTQKDEKKAKKYDFLLAKFLVKLIIKKKYDNLLGSLFICLDKGYGTNFLLGILSLIYIPISDEIRKILNKEYIVFNYNISKENKEFNDNSIDINLKNRINSWVEDMENVLFIEASDIVTKRILILLKEDSSIIKFMAEILKFFFNEINISISNTKSESYSRFIIGELTKTLKNRII